MELLQPRAAPQCFDNVVPSVQRHHGMEPTRERGRPEADKLSKLGIRGSPPGARASREQGLAVVSLVRKPPGSAGVPPEQYLAQPRPSPPPGSTGSAARAMFRPGPCASRRQGGRLPHRRETERQAKEEDAGETPALPGVAVPIGQSRYASRPFAVLRALRGLLFWLVVESPSSVQGVGLEPPSPRARFRCHSSARILAMGPRRSSGVM